MAQRLDPRGRDPFDPRVAGPHPPAFNVPPATLGLAVALIAVYVLLYLVPDDIAFGVERLLSFHATYLLAALDGRAPLWLALVQLVSHQFLHADLLHLVINVGFLLAFGSPVERLLGGRAVLLLFLACGIVGGLAETWLFTGPAGLGVPMIGASGAIMGLMGTALTLGIAGGAMRPGVLRMVVALAGLNVVVGLLSEAGLTGPYLIGWRAHLGGFALGLAVGWILARRLRARRGR